MHKKGKLTKGSGLMDQTILLNWSRVEYTSRESASAWIWKSVTNERTNGRTNGRTDGRTNKLMYGVALCAAKKSLNINMPPLCQYSPYGGSVPLETQTASCEFIGCTVYTLGQQKATETTYILFKQTFIKINAYHFVHKRQNVNWSCGPYQVKKEVGLGCPGVRRDRKRNCAPPSRTDRSDDWLQLSAAHRVKIKIKTNRLIISSQLPI